MPAAMSSLSALGFMLVAGDLAALPEWGDQLSVQLQNEWDCSVVLIGDISEREIMGELVIRSTAYCQDARVFKVEGPGNSGRFVLRHVPDRS